MSHMILSGLTGSTSLSHRSSSFLTFLVVTFAAWPCCGLFTVYGTMQSWATMHPPHRPCDSLSQSCWQPDLCKWRRPAFTICMQRLREEWEGMYKQRESESVQAFLVEGQPDTDVIRDRWAWDNSTGPCLRGSFAIYGHLHSYYSSVIISKAAVQLASSAGKANCTYSHHCCVLPTLAKINTND